MAMEQCANFSDAVMQGQGGVVVRWKRNGLNKAIGP